MRRNAKERISPESALGNPGADSPGPAYLPTVVSSTKVPRTPTAFMSRYKPSFVNEKETSFMTPGPGAYEENRNVSKPTRICMSLGPPETVPRVRPPKAVNIRSKHTNLSAREMKKKSVCTFGHRAEPHKPRTPGPGDYSTESFDSKKFQSTRNFGVFQQTSRDGFDHHVGNYMNRVLSASNISNVRGGSPLLMSSGTMGTSTNFIGSNVSPSSYTPNYQSIKPSSPAPLVYLTSSQ
eukprot:PhF_6_TR814/c0_g1_i1/m.1238